jgi:outer membrane biosynthesis protein TonB
MMSAIEHLEARKQAEEKPVEMAEPQMAAPKPEPEPTSEPKPAAAATTAAKPAASTSAASAASPATSSTRNSNPYTVALTLDPHVYHYFEKKAKEDDRTIAKYLARHLRATCPPEAGKTTEKF